MIVMGSTRRYLVVESDKLFTNWASTLLVIDVRRAACVALYWLYFFLESFHWR
jgi:hypothetical protein